jgi:probable HAF family extracellular repeat protein
MFRGPKLVLCAVSLVLSSLGVASAATYAFVALPPTGSDTMSLGLAVNRVGGVPEVAGRSAINHPTWYNRGNAALFSAAGTETNINSYISGATYSSATAIDTSGNVVGTYYGSGPLYNAFYLPAGSTSATSLPNLSSGTGTYAHSNAYGMNASGQVVGYSYATDNNYHAAVWSNTGGTWSVADLGTSGYASCANAINQSGVVAGQWTETGDIAYQDAATWTYNGSAWVLHDLINRDYKAGDGTYPYAVGSCYACAINDNGVAVGGGSLASFPSFYTFAWKYNGDGTATYLGSLSSGGAGGTIVNYPFPLSQVNSSDCALGINNSGVIVGQSAITQGGATHAFIYGYQGNNTMQDMNTLFASSIPTGWTLTSATGIDSNGDIVGAAVSPSGTLQGFLLASTLPGDANLDGTVNITDLSKVLTNYDKTGMQWADGDFNGDGTVNIADLSNVLTNYDKSLGASPAGMQVVPEPSSLLLVAAALVGLPAYAWRKRK